MQRLAAQNVKVMEEVTGWSGSQQRKAKQGLMQAKALAAPVSAVQADARLHDMASMDVTVQSAEGNNRLIRPKLLANKTFFFKNNRGKIALLMRIMS